MKKYRYKNSAKQNRREKVAFFTAFSVCMIAIGLGLWSTYASISGLDGNLPEPTESTTMTTEIYEVTKAVGNEMQGVVVEQTEAAQTEIEVDEIDIDDEADEQEETSVLSTGEPDKLQTILQVTSSLLYPVSGERVTKEYSEQPVYSKTMNDYRAHTGADFEASAGEAVFSVCEGIVDDIYEDDLYGNVIKITNGLYSVYYCGVGKEIVVTQGDSVTPGQVIAQVGEIPFESEDEPHLHMEVKVNGNTIDPLTVISNDQ